MILLSIIVAALGVTSLACLVVALWPDERPTIDELEARRRLRPDGRDVEKIEEAS